MFDSTTTLYYINLINKLLHKPYIRIKEGKNILKIISILVLANKKSVSRILQILSSLSWSEFCSDHLILLRLSYQPLNVEWTLIFLCRSLIVWLVMVTALTLLYSSAITVFILFLTFFLIESLGTLQAQKMWGWIASAWGV